MEVTNPRRVLAVSSADQSQILSRVVKDLTGAPPEPTTATSTGPSLAGTTQFLPLKTPYYTTSLPIWLDLVDDPADWAAAFLSPDAKEVLDVLGGVAVVFPLVGGKDATKAAVAATATETETSSPATPAEDSRKLLRHVGRLVREGLGGWEWDGVGLGIGVCEGNADADADIVDEWEELCAESGLEFVQVRGGERDKGRNEFGEKMGVPRIIEALEANDWAQPSLGLPGSDSDSDFGDLQGPSDSLPAAGAGAGTKSSSSRKGGTADDDELDPESLDFGFDKADFDGMKKAIWGLDDRGEAPLSPSEGVAVAVDTTTTTSRKEAVGTTEAGDGKSGGEGGGLDDGAGDDGAGLDELEVEKLEGMMRKLQGVRDMSAGMPEEQRKRMAARAVGEVMKDL